jgi:hypothetical protein
MGAGTTEKAMKTLESIVVDFQGKGGEPAVWLEHSDVREACPYFASRNPTTASKKIRRANARRITSAA